MSLLLSTWKCIRCCVCCRAKRLHNLASEPNSRHGGPSERLFRTRLRLQNNPPGKQREKRTGPAIRCDRINGCPRQGHLVAGEDEIGGVTKCLCRGAEAILRCGQAGRVIHRSLMAFTRPKLVHGPRQLAIGPTACLRIVPPTIPQGRS